MGLDKNFVVRNGLEIASDLIFADSVSNKAGIGTTTPGTKLDVNGTFNVVEDARIGGISTVEGRLDVGVGGTAFQVNPGSGRIGINSAIPEYNLDVIGDAGISSHLNVGGITTSGILHVTGLTSSVHLNVTGVTTIADARINAGFTTVTYSEAQLLNVTGVATVGGAVTMSSTGIDVNNIDVESLTGRGIDITGDITASNITVASSITVSSITASGNIDAATYTGNGSAMTGIVTTLVAGENIALSGGPETVTITGLAKTDNIKAETLVVTGVSTLGIVTGIPSIQATNFYGGSFFGDGSNLSGIDTSGNFSGKTIVCENVLASNPGVGTFGSVVINNPAGRITATEFYGDGSNLTNTGSTLSAASGTERVVFTNLTTGTMTASSTDADVAFDATTSELLMGTDKIVLNASSGNSNFAGNVFSGSGTGYVQNYAAGQISTRYDGDPDVGGGLQILRNGDLSGNRVTWLKNNGNAIFNGNVNYGDYIVSDGTTQTLQSDAGIYLRAAGTSSGWDVKIFNNGTAEFSGDIKINGTEIQLYNDGRIYGGTVYAEDGSNSNGVLFQGESSGVNVFKVSTNGSAEFKGQVVANVNNASGDDSALKAVQTNVNGYALWIGSGPTAANRTAYILPDGSANFAGTITGNLSGNASTSSNCNGNAATSSNCNGNAASSTNSTNATNSTNSRVDTDESTNATRYITFVASGGGGVQRRMYADSGMTWNPATNTLTATTFSGNATSSSNSTNSGKLDGYAQSTGTGGNTIARRDSNGDINARYFFGEYMGMSHSRATRNSDSIFYSSGDDYMRKNDASGFRASLNVPTRTGGSASGTWSISISGNASTSSNCNGNAATSTNCNGSAASASNANYANSSGSSSNCNGNAATSSNCSGNAATSSNCNGSAASASNANYASSAGSSSNCNGNAATSSNCNGNSATVSINYNNNSNSSYQILWGSSNSVYGTAGVTLNASSNTIFCSTLAASSDVISNYSDKRLKEKISDIENAIEKVCAIDTMYYKHNDVAKKLGYEGDKKQIGVTAQSVNKVCPEVINLAPIDNDGEGVSKSGENYMTVDYSRLVPLLIEAVKEQQKQINELKSQLKTK